VLPSYSDPCSEWHGIVFVREGWFQGALFRFVLTLPTEYPSCPPLLRFTSTVYHPLVDPNTGNVDLRGWIPNWNSEESNVVLLLGFVRLMFYQKKFFPKPVEFGGDAGNSKYIMNDEAARCFCKDSKGFLEEVHKCVQASQREAGFYMVEETQDDSPENSRRSSNDESVYGGSSDRRQHWRSPQQPLFPQGTLFSFDVSSEIGMKQSQAVARAISEFVSRPGVKNPATIFREWLDTVHMPEIGEQNLEKSGV